MDSHRKELRNHLFKTIEDANNLEVIEKKT